MRILYVTHYATLYGANRGLLDLIDGVRELGVHAHVLVPSPGDLIGALEQRGVPFRILPFKRWMHYSRLKAPVRLAANLATLPLLVHQARRWEIDLLHTNSSLTPVGALIAWALRKPHLWHVKEFGWEDFRMRPDLGKAIFERFLSRADAVVAMSEALQRTVLANVSTRTYVIPDGIISATRLASLSPEPCPPDNNPGYRFTLVGLLHEGKGQEQAIRALSLLKSCDPRPRLVIAGSEAFPGYLDHLKSLTRERGLNGQIEFPGYLPDPYPAFRSADAALVCSASEGFGRVTAEAMACARPVIGNNGGATGEIIEPGINGLLYDGRDEDLADCMRCFIEQPEWAASLGISGREKVERLYTIEGFARKVFGIYQELLGSG